MRSLERSRRGFELHFDLARGMSALRSLEYRWKIGALLVYSEYHKPENERERFIAFSVSVVLFAFGGQFCIIYALSQVRNSIATEIFSLSTLSHCDPNGKTALYCDGPGVGF